MGKVKLYYSFLFTSLILFVVSFCVNKESNLDFNVHDTYYVIAYKHLCWLLSIVSFVCFAIYLSFDKAQVTLFALISKIHICGSIFVFAALFFPYSEFMECYKGSHFPLYDDLQYVNMIQVAEVLLFLLFHFLFIINIFASIIRKTQER